MAVKFAGPWGGSLEGTSGDDVLWGASGSDIISGLGGNDYLYGGSDSDDLDGGPGTDVLRGNGGNDDLFGNSGSDYLKGGAGNDTLRGGKGVDVLQGGSGADDFEFRIEDGTSTDTIQDFEVGLDQLKLLNGLQAIRDFREDFNLDGDRDTVLVLSNQTGTFQAAVVILDLGRDLNWASGSGNVLLA